LHTTSALPLRPAEAAPDHGAENGDSSRALVYCLIPRALVPRLHGPLEEHFAGEPGVEVIAQRREGERRDREERRVADGHSAPRERRLVRALTGRRVADRRAPVRVVDPPRLPLLAASDLRKLVFVERDQPTALWNEDVDTARLVTRLQAGERELLGELYMRYYARVFSYVRMTLRDVHEAEDVAQEVFLRVLRAVPGWERRDVPFRAWLFRIVRHVMIDRLRERARVDLRSPEEVGRALEETSASAHDDDLLRLDEREWLRQLRRLPGPEQQVIVLRYVLDFTPREIGGLLERSPESVRQLQQRALWVLRERLVVGADHRSAAAPLR
jgi:RNA polymerase sigma-70 factor (ECF subfamily)